MVEKWDFPNKAQLIRRKKTIKTALGLAGDGASSQLADIHIP